MVSTGNELAKLALHQRETIHDQQVRLNTLELAERQVRDLTAENTKLKRRIAELESLVDTQKE